MSKPKGRKKPDPVEYQFHVRVKGHPKGADVSGVRRDAIRHWIETGETETRHTKITAVGWRNPARKSAEKRAWRWAKQKRTIERARGTLRLSALVAKTGYGIFRGARGD